MQNVPSVKYFDKHNTDASVMLLWIVCTVRYHVAFLTKMSRCIANPLVGLALVKTGAHNADPKHIQG